MTKRPLMGVVVPAHEHLGIDAALRACDEHEEYIRGSRRMDRLQAARDAVVESAMAWCQAGGFLTATATYDMIAACAALDAAEKEQP